LGVDGWIAGERGGFWAEKYFINLEATFILLPEKLNPKSNNLNCQFSHQLPEKKQ
jgi:hypothetical protein